MKRKRYIIGGLIACLALVYLVYILLGSTMPYYSTVSELKASGESIYGKDVKVTGEVVHESIEFDTENLIMTLDITDGQEILSVVFKGDERNTLENHGQVTIEGKLDSSGEFHASSILTKCPSRYEGE